MELDPQPPAPSETASRRPPVGLLALAALVVLATAETVVALSAPLRAATDADWRAAAAEVRKGFQAGDLIVAAPEWSDQVMRRHLGDLVPSTVAGRMDAARYGRVWEISQRGARSADARGSVAATARHGALTVRRIERPAPVVTYDFLARLGDARVTRVDPSRGALPCPVEGDRFQCPDMLFNHVKAMTVEVEGALRRGIYAQPVGGATVAIEFPAAQLGRELVVAGGLHNVWMRKSADGVVDLKVLVDGKPVLTHKSGSGTAWSHTRADTSPWAGRTAAVRFEITSAKPYARHFAFAAEARGS